jgi:hypothetical protein
MLKLTILTMIHYKQAKTDNFYLAQQCSRSDVVWW